jgi:hypothetical protein
MSFIERKYAGDIGFGQASAPALTFNQTEVIVDSNPVLPTEIWLVESLSWHLFDPTEINSQGDLRLSGVFLCPPGTSPAVPGTAGPPVWNNALSIMNFVRVSSTMAQFLGFNMGGGNGPFQVTTGQMFAFGIEKEFIVPPGWFIRGIYSSTSSATPIKPGAVMTMTWLYARRKIQECD